jgi:hypothetical protein
MRGACQKDAACSSAAQFVYIPRISFHPLGSAEVLAACAPIRPQGGLGAPGETAVILLTYGTRAARPGAEPAQSRLAGSGR